MAALCRKQRVQSDAMAKAKRSTVQFKRKQLPAALAARKKNKPMRLKAAARVAKKRQEGATGESVVGSAAAACCLGQHPLDTPPLALPVQTQALVHPWRQARRQPRRWTSSWTVPLAAAAATPPSLTATTATRPRLTTATWNWSMRRCVARGSVCIAVLCADDRGWAGQVGAHGDEELPGAEHSDSGAPSTYSSTVPSSLTWRCVVLQTRRAAGTRRPPWQTCVPPTGPSAPSCHATRLTWKR